MGLLSLLLTDLSFVPLPGLVGPILSALDGDIVHTTIDQFPAHRVKLSASDVRAVKSIDPMVLPCGVIIEEEGLGEVARGYIMSPSGQITDDNHEINLVIPNRTEALRWDTTGPGWTAATGIDTIANRLASRSPPWSANVIDTGDDVLSVSPVHWQGNDPATSVVDLNAITKDADVAEGWNVGAISTERVTLPVPSGGASYGSSSYNESSYNEPAPPVSPLSTKGDCAVSSVAFGSSTYRMFGLTASLPDYSYEHLTHAIDLSTDGTTNPNNGVLRIFEGGTFVGSFGGYYPGDYLTVAVEGGVVKYKNNDVVFHTSSAPPVYPIYAGCSLYSPNAAILGASFSSYVAPKDQRYAIAFENATILDALIQLAARTYRHIRQGVNAQGVPEARLELGLFNAPPTMVLKTADAESPSQVRAKNPYTRLIQEADYTWDTSDVITIGAVFGGGTGDTQVKLESLWRIVNDPDYPGYNKWGNKPDSIFPEYDPVNFPIERRVSLNGTFYYVVINTAMVAEMKAKGHWSGEVWGGLDDSSIVYVDQSPYAQKEAVERTLYVSAITKLRRHSVLHFNASVTVDGRGRVTLAGDQVNVIISRTGLTQTGLRTTVFKEVDVNINPMVTSVVRRYRDDNVDEVWGLSTQGRRLDDDSAALSDTLRQMEAVRITPTTSESTFVIGPVEQSINSAFPLDIPIRLPNTMRRMTAATLKLVIKPVRHNVKFATIEDGEHDHPVPIPPLAVNAFSIIPHDHTGITPFFDPGDYFVPLPVTGSSDISHGQGTSSPAGRFSGVGRFNGVNKGGSATKGGSASKSGSATKGGTSQNNTNLSHVHYIQMSSAASQPAGNAMYFVPQGDNSFLGTIGGVTGSFHTNQWTGSDSHSSSPDHSHPDTISVNDGIGVDDQISVNDGIAVLDSLGIADNLGVSGGGFVNDYVGGRLLNNGNTNTNYNPFTQPLTGTPTFRDDAGTFFGVTVASNTTTASRSGLHTHALAPDIVETDLGGRCQIWVNPGDGVYIDRSPELGGPWTSSTDILGDRGLEIFLQAPGKEIGIRIVAENTAGNPTGLCNVQVSGTFEIQKAAVAETIYAG